MQHSLCVSVQLVSECGTKEETTQRESPSLGPPPPDAGWGCRICGGGLGRSHISLGEHFFFLLLKSKYVVLLNTLLEVLRQVPGGVFMPEDFSKLIWNISHRGIGNMQLIPCKCGCVIALTFAWGKITAPEASVLFWYNLFNVFKVSPTEK